MKPALEPGAIEADEIEARLGPTRQAPNPRTFGRLVRGVRQAGDRCPGRSLRRLLGCAAHALGSGAAARRTNDPNPHRAPAPGPAMGVAEPYGPNLGAADAVEVIPAALKAGSI